MRIFQSDIARITVWQFAMPNCGMQHKPLLDLIWSLCYSKKHRITEGSGRGNKLAIGRLTGKASRLGRKPEKVGVLACSLDTRRVLNGARHRSIFLH